MKCPKCSGEMVYTDRVIKWYEYTSDCEVAWFDICTRCNIRIDGKGNISLDADQSDFDRVADLERRFKARERHMIGGNGKKK